MQPFDTATSNTDEHWYIAYTLPRHEKAIAQRLTVQEISCYVPLYSETRTWRQRRVQVELPLFPCYVFVKMPLDIKTRLLSAPGVVRLLAMSGAAVIFPDEEMSALQSSLKHWSARPYPFHSSGKRIHLTAGPFAGFEGTILRRNGKRKIIITLDLLSSCILLDADAADAQLSVS